MKYPKHLLFSLSILFTFNLAGQDRGELISDNLLLSFSKSEIQDLYAQFGILEFLFPIEYDSLQIHKLVYWTPDAQGTGMEQASGLITIPVESNCDFPLMNYNHGTGAYDRVISDLNAGLMQHFVGVPFAANGYVTAIPDYLGYGATSSDHPHPFTHAKSEATSVVDMLRAAREFCSIHDISLNDQLFLLGYSHGAHVTMSTHRELEALHSDEFTVTASAPGSGAYDLSGIMRDSTLNSDYYSNPFYIAFSTLSYQFVYGDLYENLSEVFVEPWDSIIPLMLDTEDPQSHWRDSLPRPGYKLWQADFLDSIRTDTMHPFNMALRDNDVYDWIPQAPLRLYYCEEDEDIPFENALFTRDHMLALGATGVSAVHIGDGLNHVQCATPAVLQAKLWFDSFKLACTPVDVVDINRADKIKIYPNPFSDLIYIEADGLEDNVQMEVRIFDLMGRPVHRDQLDTYSRIQINMSNLPAGSYLVQLSSNGQQLGRRIVKTN